MATHDYVISNASGAAVRADLNNALAAIVTNNSSATAPTTTYAYQWWADTGSSPPVMKLRNAANSAWITLFQLDGEWSTLALENGTAAAPSIYFKDSGTDTGFYSPGTDTVAATTGGTQRFTIDTAAVTSTLPVLHPLGAVGTPSITFTGDLNTGIFSPAADTIAFVEGGSEAARIDSSGRFLVGTSSAPVGGGAATFARLQIEGNSFSSTGPGSIALRMGTAPTSIVAGNEIGQIAFAANNNGEFARIECYADATAGNNDHPGRLVFSTTADGAASPTTRFTLNRVGDAVFSNTSAIYPATDNAVICGGSSNRWSAVWAANGTIQTSDERAKVAITDSTLGADFVKALRPVSYKWLDGGKRDTGERDEDNNYIYESVPGERTHWGFIAQEVKQAVDAAGVDFGGWVLTDKDDPDSQQALRYDQFIAPLTKALQEALEKIETLEQRLADAGIA